MPVRVERRPPGTRPVPRRQSRDTGSIPWPSSTRAPAVPRRPWSDQGRRRRRGRQGGSPSIDVPSRSCRLEDAGQGISLGYQERGGGPPCRRSLPAFLKCPGSGPVPFSSSFSGALTRRVPRISGPGRGIPCRWPPSWSGGVRGSPLSHHCARWPFPRPASIHPYCERKNDAKNARQTVTRSPI